jgi:hypothetical protein
MSDVVEENISSEAALLLEKLRGLEPDEPRYHVIKATLQYKTSWLELAERLNKVANEKLYKDWGYKTFRDYCARELFISPATAKKLVRGFQWLDEQLPDFMPNYIDESDAPQAQQQQRVAPDMDTVQLLMNAQRDVERERMPQDAYADIKRRALIGELDVAGVKSSLREVMLPPPEEPGGEPLKVLRRALAATEKVVAQLEELNSDDEEIMDLAARLRDRIFDLVNLKMEQLASLDGPGAVHDPGPSGTTRTLTLVDDSAMAGHAASLPAGKHGEGARVEQLNVLVGSKDSFLSNDQ